MVAQLEDAFFALRFAGCLGAMGCPLCYGFFSVLQLRFDMDVLLDCSPPVGGLGQ